MKTIYTLMPDRLNLNGEQGNVLVLSRRLEWQSVSHQVVEIQDLAQLEKLLPKLEKSPRDCFVFMGQGSFETFSYLEKQSALLHDLLARLVFAGIPTLAVGTCYEIFANAPKSQLFFSEFIKSDFKPGGFEILGYASTGYDLPALVTKGDNTVLTTMHGPVLAKNPKLADWFLAEMGVVREVVKELIEVDEIVAKIWDLEDPR